MYRLRWVFHYQNGKTKYGIWNGASPLRQDMAAFQPKTGLISAEIEGETIDGTVHKLYQVDGHNYVSAAWEKIVNLPILSSASSLKVSGKLYGLSFYTPTEKITVNIYGKIRRRLLNSQEKLFKNFEEHTR